MGGRIRGARRAAAARAHRRPTQRADDCARAADVDQGFRPTGHDTPQPGARSPHGRRGGRGADPGHGRLGRRGRVARHRPGNAHGGRVAARDIRSGQAPPTSLPTGTDADTDADAIAARPVRSPDRVRGRCACLDGADRGAGDEGACRRPSARVPPAPRPHAKGPAKHAVPAKRLAVPAARPAFAR